MKKTIIFVMALPMVMLSACSSDDDVQTIPENKEIKIIANLPQESKTRVAYTDASAGSTYSLTAAWAEGDNVRYCYKNASNAEKKRTVNVSISGSGSTGTFSLSDGDPAASSYIYCHHPAGSNYFTSIADNTSTCVVTPPTNAGYIFKNTSDLTSANYLVGSLQYSSSKSNLNMTFKNIYALLKFNIYIPYEKATEYGVSRFTSVTIKGYNGSPAAAANVSIKGDVTIAGSTGAIAWSNTESGEYTKSSNIDLTGDTSSKSGYRLGVLYVLVTPQTWNGLYLSVTDNAQQVNNSYTNHTYVYTKTGNITLDAGKMYGINITLEKTMIQ